MAQHENGKPQRAMALRMALCAGLLAGLGACGGGGSGGGFGIPLVPPAPSPSQPPAPGPVPQPPAPAPDPGTPPPPGPPAAVVEGPARIVANTLYRFNAKVSGATASAWQWVWGDGSPDGDGNPVRHVWRAAKAGFDVVLKATTDHGVLTATQASAAIGQPISVGWEGGCAIRADQTLACWGRNNYGQLGIGTQDNGPHGTPATVPGMNGVVSVSTQRQHACAAKDDGSVWCWGDNFSGQLGSELPGGAGASSSPVVVPGVDQAIAVSTGQSHSCALQSTGGVKCWGAGVAVGDGGSLSARFAPVAVKDLVDAVAISSGDAFNCALRANGEVACWGRATDGQTGNGRVGNDVPPELVPVTVSGLNGVATIAAGYHHACALKLDGTVACWGRGSDYQLGDGSRNSSGLPVAVLGLNDAAALALGGINSCALKSDRSVACWGGSGAWMGMGDIAKEHHPAPETVPGLTDVAALDGAETLYCALRTDGSAACAGHGGASGALGDGSDAYQSRAHYAPVHGGASYWR